MTNPMQIARLNARNLLADVQVALESGSWIVADMADPTMAVIELETILGLPAPAETIARATDQLAACCGAAVTGGDWLNPANDYDPLGARTALAGIAA